MGMETALEKVADMRKILEGEMLEALDTILARLNLAEEARKVVAKADPRPPQLNSWAIFKNRMAPVLHSRLLQQDVMKEWGAHTVYKELWSFTKNSFFGKKKPTATDIQNLDMHEVLDKVLANLSGEGSGFYPEHKKYIGHLCARPTTPLPSPKAATPAATPPAEDPPAAGAK